MSIKCHFSQLIIPSDPVYAAAASKYATEIAGIIGFDSQDIQTIASGLNQAIAALIEYSFEPGEQATLQISCERIPEGLKVVVKDKGLPFGESLPEPSQIATLPSSAATFGARIFQLKKYLDEVSLHNLGHDGKEIVLIKYLASKTLADYRAECELDPYEPSPPELAAGNFEQKFMVRRMKASEAVEVSKTVYKAYGYTYARDYMYFPEKLIALNESGQVQSVVVVVGDHEIAGHCAVQYWEENPRVAELAAGVVKPEYRSRGYFALLTEYLVNEVCDKALLGIFVHTVSNHTISQKVGHQVGLHDCAIRLGLVPPSISFKGFSEALRQKPSILIQFRYLSHPSTLTLHLPDSHQAIVAAIYENLGIAPEFSGNYANRKLDKRSVFKIQVVASLNFARILLDSYGPNTVAEIKGKLKELCYKKIEVVNLYLNMFDPLTAVMTEEFEKLGFFFAGVMPGGLAGGDALILQYLNNVPIDYKEIKVASDMAHRILGHIKAHDPN